MLKIDMKEISFDHPVLTNLKLLKIVGPLLASVGVVSDGLIGNTEAPLRKLHKQK